MAEKKLPTGVGKKIVEALKKQDDIDVNIQDNCEPEEESITISSGNNDVSFNNIDAQISNYENLITDQVNDVDLNQIEETQPEISEAPAYENPQNIYDNTTQFQEQMYQSNVMSSNPQDVSMASSDDARDFNMPSNVAVLKKLITQLPNGVTKQTGAQIIRQTMEALGISMNSVLAEAQHVQDGLNDSIRDCMTTVNEYKQNIMTLEKQVIDYQKQVKSVNDLISLFILTDK